MRLCKLFDKYRDGELSSAERSQYELHLASCEDCRIRMALLNNLVRCIKAEEEQPPDLADRIARRAFERSRSWDFEVLTWLRPAPALAALTLMVVLFSSLLMVSKNHQGVIYSEYEKLLEEANALTQSASASQVRNYGELIPWLEQEGNRSD